MTFPPLTRTLMGIDPGLRTTGWGCIQHTPHGLLFKGAGIIKTHPQQTEAERLGYLLTHLIDLLTTYAPDGVAVEEIFVNKNPHSSLKLAMARGVALCAPGHLGIPVCSYPANTIKKSVVGYGHADKTQVAWGVRHLLGVADCFPKDASDALATAICHGQFLTQIA